MTPKVPHVDGECGGSVLLYKDGKRADFAGAREDRQRKLERMLAETEPAPQNEDTKPITVEAHINVLEIGIARRLERWLKKVSRAQ